VKLGGLHGDVVVLRRRGPLPWRSIARRVEMTTWPTDELRRIAETDDMGIALLREDGTTYGTPTWIWSVVANGALSVRAYKRNEFAVPGGAA